MVNIKKYLYINQLVNIEVVSEAGVVSRYSSRVENLNDEEIILVTPIKDRNPLYLPPGSMLNVLFWDKQAVYTFSTTLLKNIKGHIYFLAVTFPEKIERVQKREFVRVELTLDVLLTYKNKENEEVKIPCKSKDVSGGGMQLAVSNAELPEKGSEVQVAFSLNDKLTQAKGILVWKDNKRDSNGKACYLMAVKFTEILEADRQVIIKEVYARQIELRRKGLL